MIENISKINHIVFDKTGTAYTTIRCICNLYSGNKLDDEAQTCIALLLAQSPHPLSKAIVQYLDKDIKCNVENFKWTTGKGVEGWIEDKYYKVGSKNLF